MGSLSTNGSVSEQLVEFASIGFACVHLCVLLIAGATILRARMQAREQQLLLAQLESALQEEADLHRRESQRLNEELYLQEKRECDWHVERRVMETKVQELEEEMRQRDDLDGAIESKMAALFGRLKQLEDDNLRLEQTNEVLNSRLGSGSAPDAPVSTLQPVDDDGLAAEAEFCQNNLKAGECRPGAGDPALSEGDVAEPTLSEPV